MLLISPPMCAVRNIADAGLRSRPYLLGYRTAGSQFIGWDMLTYKLSELLMRKEVVVALRSFNVLVQGPMKTTEHLSCYDECRKRHSWTTLMESGRVRELEMTVAQLENQNIVNPVLKKSGSKSTLIFRVKFCTHFSSLLIWSSK